MNNRIRPTMASHRLDLPSICDICGKARSTRKHAACSRTRQQLKQDEWASYTTLTIETDIGSIVFAGSASQYEDFLFPANGDYKAKLTVWRLPQDYLATQFEGGSTGAIRKNLGVEHPAKPTGWYSYSFRFTLQASAEVALSTERLEQGGVAALSITGLTGETAPAVETDLGSVQCVRLGSGWRAYIPAAYNASAGGHL